MWVRFLPAFKRGKLTNNIVFCSHHIVNAQGGVDSQYWSYLSIVLLMNRESFFFFYHRRYNMLGLLKESHFIIYLLEIPKYLPGDSCPTEATKWKGENSMLHWESAILYGFTGLIRHWYMPRCIYNMTGLYI